VCDEDRAKAEYAAMPFGANVYTDYREFLKDDSVDGVIVALPSHLHHDAVLEALAADKHIFCEKTMTNRADRSRDLVEPVQKSGKVFQVGYMKRFNAGYRAIKDSLDKIGPVTSASIRIHLSYGIFLEGPVPDVGDGWNNDHERCGGGPLVQGGSHLIDLMMFLFGKPETVTGYIKRDLLKNEYANNLFFRMEDGLCVHLEFCGTRARGFGHANGAWEEKVNVVGLNGKAYAENCEWQGRINPTCRIVTADDPGLKEVFTFGTSAWASELQAFVKGMDDGVCYGSTVEDGYRVDFILEELKKLQDAKDVILPLRFEY
jgi:predicted dehydrogenase